MLFRSLLRALPTSRRAPVEDAHHAPSDNSEPEEDWIVVTEKPDVHHIKEEICRDISPSSTASTVDSGSDRLVPADVEAESEDGKTDVEIDGQQPIDDEDVSDSEQKIGSFDVCEKVRRGSEEDCQEDSSELALGKCEELVAEDMRAKLEAEREAKAEHDEDKAGSRDATRDDAHMKDQHESLELILCEDTGNQTDERQEQLKQGEMHKEERSRGGPAQYQQTEKLLEERVDEAEIECEMRMQRSVLQSSVMRVTPSMAEDLQYRTHPASTGTELSRKLQERLRCIETDGRVFVSSAEPETKGDSDCSCESMQSAPITMKDNEAGAGSGESRRPADQDATTWCGPPACSGAELARKLSERLRCVEMQGDVFSSEVEASVTDACTSSSGEVNFVLTGDWHFDKYGAYIHYANSRHALFDFKELDDLELEMMGTDTET
eukprot:gnl/TRDRNA2_/TRDRNA2_184483_c0_seq1.p1 gnl/TRDRNA2_/TRDRNA2_184483_c0~~gnl/TRDRNA2_/TRDRNA2_184483_c0_seq1.p1  ORF type:complete len:436 (+),score=105.35 gnl/TRDRNA2_/TRDRNA2_184483_c0_seq1:147-1454(+)